MAETYNVYFGTIGNLVLVSEGQEDLSFDLSDYLPLEYNTTYYWRIDSINEYGTTTGDTWTFTTYELYYPTPSDSNMMETERKLVAFANNKVWVES